MSDSESEKRTNKAIFNLCTRDRTVFKFLVRLYVESISQTLAFYFHCCFCCCIQNVIEFMNIHKKLDIFPIFFFSAYICYVRDEFLIHSVGSITNEMYWLRILMDVHVLYACAFFVCCPRNYCSSAVHIILLLYVPNII